MSRRDLPTVCFLAGTLGRGGAERQLVHQVGALVEAGATPRVLCLTRGETYEAPLADLGAPPEHVGAHPGRFRRLRTIVRALRTSRPDVIQSTHFFTNLYACFAARRLGCREIGAIRSDVTHELASHGWLGRRGLWWPRTLAANSQAAIGAGVSLGVPRARLVHLPNAIDLAGWSVPRRDGREAPFHVLFVGRFVAAKRLDRLIAHLAALRDRTTPAWTATLVGDGPLRSKVRGWIDEHGLADQVTLAGELADPRAAYAAADLCVLASDHEGSPNVLLEAMAAGLPVVATDVGGVGELIREGETGLRFAPADHAGFVEGLVRLIGNRAEAAAMGAAGRRFVEAKHARSGLIDHLERLYQHVRRAR